MPTFTTGTPGEGARGPVTPGTYRLRVIESVEKLSKANNIMVEQKYDILDNDGQKIGTVYDNLVFTEAAKWKLDNYLRALGKHPGPDQDIDIQCRHQLGEELLADIGHEPGKNGKVYNAVLDYLAPEF